MWSGGEGNRDVWRLPLTEPARQICVSSVMPREQRGDREMGLIAVKVEELSTTTNAAGALVGQCRFEVMMH